MVSMSKWDTDTVLQNWGTGGRDLDWYLSCIILWSIINYILYTSNNRTNMRHMATIGQTTKILFVDRYGRCLLHKADFIVKILLYTRVETSVLKCIVIQVTSETVQNKTRTEITVFRNNNNMEIGILILFLKSSNFGTKRFILLVLHNKIRYNWNTKILLK